MYIKINIYIYIYIQIIIYIYIFINIFQLLSIDQFIFQIQKLIQFYFFIYIVIYYFNHTLITYFFYRKFYNYLYIIILIFFSLFIKYYINNQCLQNQNLNFKFNLQFISKMEQPLVQYIHKTKHLIDAVEDSFFDDYQKNVLVSNLYLQKNPSYRIIYKGNLYTRFQGQCLKEVYAILFDDRLEFYNDENQMQFIQSKSIFLLQDIILDLRKLEQEDYENLSSQEKYFLLFLFQKRRFFYLHKIKMNILNGFKILEKLVFQQTIQIIMKVLQYNKKQTQNKIIIFNYKLPKEKVIRKKLSYRFMISYKQKTHKKNYKQKQEKKNIYIQIYIYKYIYIYIYQYIFIFILIYIYIYIYVYFNFNFFYKLFYNIYQFFFFFFNQRNLQKIKQICQKKQTFQTYVNQKKFTNKISQYIQYISISKKRTQKIYLNNKFIFLKALYQKQHINYQEHQNICMILISFKMEYLQKIYISKNKIMNLILQYLILPYLFIIIQFKILIMILFHLTLLEFKLLKQKERKIQPKSLIFSVVVY
ncbi:hypothetical protein IMG5_000830 [Ichthyophthirius multifiliis]|uniref:Transmembrane protein n=1 Tax=Ichthyophthirius multifiliis TaxID=5932 RepID=G0QIX0_ICHMU|nr:hypothetical protein IMG5_000830 [Ichthyophthirius multifiliis]EGR34855.1 hypothetical protein IMG5_000830 [Ichthyophthirius multifiliis]|eukprot:XP_004040159.1 hypothetical protein IMG5_000830 [Ichthyophthirius multifiliis]